MPCRHCGANDHIGKNCPRRKGVSFGSTSDSPAAARAVVRPAAEEAYRGELRKPPQMAAELADFSRRVFANPTCMAPRSERRAYDIYVLYCGHTGGPVDTSPPSPAELNMFRLLGDVVDAGQKFLDGIFQETLVLDSTAKRAVRLKFDSARELFERPGALPMTALTDFIHFFPPGQHDRITHRLYLNVTLVNVPVVTQSLQRYMTLNRVNSGVCYFKVSGPRNIGLRAESFVVYCRDQASAVTLGQHLAKKHSPSVFMPAIPSMTTRVPDTIGGLAVGAEPNPTATGMKARREGGDYRESSQSFGSIRSELLAMAVVNYLENGDRVEGDSELDIFNRFVCAAFRGFGLDPLNPGN